MKTIKEWLEELPEPYRTQALELYDTYWGDKDVPKTVSLPEALRGAFVWGNTTQGYEYWSSLYKKLQYENN